MQSEGETGELVAPGGVGEAVREITVFVASPSDVWAERALVEAAITRLNAELRAFARFRAIRWENEFYRATYTFQEQIPEPSQCDIVIVIFGNKLGMPLPADTKYLLSNGKPYPSGTAYELLSSLEAAKTNAKQRGREEPDIFVFRRSTEPSFAARDRALMDVAVTEQERLNCFFTEHFMTAEGAFKRSVNDFADTDDFERKVGKLLRNWVEKAFSLRPKWDVARNGSPFRALEPFEARHSAVYFGRDIKLWRAIDVFAATGGEEAAPARPDASRKERLPFLLVVGPSGSGKSSFIRAGIIPRLRASGLFRPVDLCRVAVMRPGTGASAFASLANALFNDGSEAADPGGYGPALPELAEGRHDTTETLCAFMESAPADVAGPLTAALDAIGAREGERAGLKRVMRADLLLLVDQLEELFVCPERERLDFAKALLALAQSRRVWIIATLRADLYDTVLDPNSKLLELKDKGGSYDLASPGPAEIEEILDRSADAAGLVYETDAKTEKRLDRVLEDDAAGRDALPLLQFTLDKLFAKSVVTGPVSEGKRLLTFAAYEELGRLDGAINDAAEAALRDVARTIGPGQADEVLVRLLRRLAQQSREGVGATPSGQGPDVAVQGAAWTARAAALPDEVRAAPEFALANALSNHRLLVFDRAGERERLVRLAHDRVLTSWKRAARILRDEGDFFRVRQDVESEWRRWCDNEERRDFLLRGLPLDSAQAMNERHGPELDGALRAYIRASQRRDQWRRRGVTTAASVFGVVALLASAASVLAFSAEHKSARDFAAAKTAANDLATSIAPKLRSRKDIGTDTLDIVFGLTERLVSGMEAAAGQGNGPVERTLHRGFAIIDTWFGGVPRGDDAADLARTHANMDYQFAETYHAADKGLEKALERAEASLHIRQWLVDHGDRSTETQTGLALSHMEMADLLRRQIENRPPKLGQGGEAPPRRDYSVARTEQGAAVSVLGEAFGKAPDDAGLGAAYAKSLTGLGDLDRLVGEAVASATDYARARDVAIHLFRQRGESVAPEAVRDSVISQRELAWAWRKTGEVQEGAKSFAEAAKTYAEEVCIRRHLLAHLPDESLLTEDLPYALVKLGDALSRSVPPVLDPAADAYNEALEIRGKLVGGNDTNPKYYRDFVATLQRRSDLERARSSDVLADIFQQAAADVSSQIATVTFNPESEGNPEKRRQLDGEARRRRAGGVIALINGTGRLVVERQMLDFRLDRLPRIAEAGRTCWEELLPLLHANKWTSDAAALGVAAAR